MRARVFLQDLMNKKVVDSDGTEIGSLHSITADAETGFLQKIFVKPSLELDTSRFKKQSDFIVIPFEAVSAVRDVVVIDSKKIAEQKGSGERREQ
ncbi:MAG: Sporulation protein YlmC [Methanophagales archaeon]|nr:PRC-barrel domain-containing protein [Methanophagales archaeon]MCU4140068.1 Sporulation protein YlmC [Methanophagales archaeon]